MKYEVIKPIASKEDVLLILRGKKSSSSDKINALLGAVEGINDHEWLEALYLQYIEDYDYGVAHAAIQGLGYTARILRKLNIELVVNRLLNLMKRKDRLFGVINDTFDDIEMFMKVKIDRVPDRH